MRKFWRENSGNALIKMAAERDDFRKPTSAHTNLPKVRRKVEQWKTFQKRNILRPKSGFIVEISGK